MAGGKQSPLLDEESQSSSAAAQQKAAAEALRQRRLVICFCLMIVIGLGNRITSIVQYDRISKYPLFVNLITTFAYLPASLLYIIPTIRYRPGIISDESRAIPTKVWFIMGTLDSIAGVMQSLSLDKISNGGLITLLLQSAIPISMLITKIFLKTKYTMSQLIGALIVIVGLVAALIPTLIGGDNTNAASTAIWSSVLILSCVPMCLSSVYKERALGDTDCDSIYMNYMVAVWQFIVSFPLLIPSGYASEVPVQDLPTNIYQGMMCYFGVNSQDGDNCAFAPLFTNLYILFNIGYNILIILMLKYGSSNILWLCLTIQVPIANLAFALPFMPKSKPAQWENALGLVLIMAGLITYRFWPLVVSKYQAWTGKEVLDEEAETMPMISNDSDPRNSNRHE